MRKTGGRRDASSALLLRGASRSTESHTCVRVSVPRATLHRRMLLHRFHSPYYDYSLRIPKDQNPSDPGGDE
jgi:hypothetical protein